MKRVAKVIDIAPQLSELAAKIADNALEDGVSLEAQIEAFRVLTTYHVNTTKINSKLPDPEDEGNTFDSLKSRVTAATSGTGTGNARTGRDS